MKAIVSSVGAVIDARCTKCAKITNHIVVAIVANKPVNVQCNTCDDTHRYRQSAASPKTAKPAGTLPIVKPEEWAEFRKGMNEGAARDYDMEKEYRVGSVIRHPSFGFGLVQHHTGSRKMEVLFEAGRKIMRCK